MNDVKALIALFLILLAKLCRFNAFAGAFAGFCYGMIASLLDREFAGMDSTQLSLLGAGCFVAFFALRFGLVAASNCLVSEADPLQKNDSPA